MKLLIIESPSKQKTIQKYLGSDWKICASLGHIRGLENNIDFLKNDFDAKYEYIKEKAKAIKVLKEEASKADEIYLGSDDDMEGEQISYSIAILLKLNPKTTKRIVYREVTDKAIKHAIHNPRVIDINRVNAQQTRAMLDMMIGFTLSPLLWKYISRGSGLSIGRCQGPALRLVLERENLIAQFKSSSSWILRAQWRGGGARGFKEPFTGQMNDELEDEESAVNYMEQVCQNSSGTVTENTVRPWTEGAPLPLITSTLQQQASALYSIPPKQVMRIAQLLYEAGLISYMRTDHAVLSEEAKESCKKWVIENYGSDYIESKSEVPVKVKMSKKELKEKDKNSTNVQAAHEAIHPIKIECTTLSSDGHFGEKVIDHQWTAQDKKVYELIWRRTVQSVMAPCKGEVCKVKMQINKDEDFTWSAGWKRTTFEGWKKAGSVAQIDEGSESDSEDSSAWPLAMSLHVGTKVEWSSMKASPYETKAQGRYTEATLIRELEKHGIGRPSTFSNLMSVIQDKGYVEIKDIPTTTKMITEYSMEPCKWPATKVEMKKKVGAEKQKLIPTELGRCVLEFILKHFSDLFDYGFTGGMEKRLDRVAEGQEEWKQVLRDMWMSYKDRYETLSSEKVSGDDIKSDKIKELCKMNDRVLKAVMSKKGPLLLIESNTKESTVFLGWPNAVQFESMNSDKALEFYEEWKKKKDASYIGLWNGVKIEKKSGKFGDYLQCGDVNIPFIVDEGVEAMLVRFETKKSSNENGVLKAFKEYEIRTGQYGPYIYKTSLKKRQFVSLPKDISIDELTEKDAEALYKAGLEKISHTKKWSKK